MIDKKIGVGIIGIGWWAGVHAEALKNSHHLKLVACHTRTKEKGVEFAKKHGCDYEENLDALLKRKDIDAVIITTPHTTHKEIAIKSALAGKHALVEKPLALTVEDCISIIEAFKNNGLVLAVGHDRRFMPQHRKMKEIIDEGKIGKLIMAEGNYSTNLALNLTPDKWRFYKSESPGGLLSYLTIHIIDTLRYLVGTDVEEVTAYLDKLETKAEIFDFGMAVLKFKNGVYGYVGGSFLIPRIFYVNIFGIEGNLFSNERGELKIQKKDELELKDLKIEMYNHMQKMHENFALSILDKKKPEVDGYEGLKNVAIMNSIIESSMKKKAVNVEYKF